MVGRMEIPLPTFSSQKESELIGGRSAPSSTPPRKKRVSLIVHDVVQMDLTVPAENNREELDLDGRMERDVSVTASTVGEATERDDGERILNSRRRNYINYGPEVNFLQGKRGDSAKDSGADVHEGGDHRDGYKR